MKRYELRIEGMHCEGCVHRIRNVLSTVKGVGSYDISLESKKLDIEVKKDKVMDEVIKKIENLGFEVVIRDEKKSN